MADIQRLFFSPVNLLSGAAIAFARGCSMSRSSTTSRIMYIESKADGLNGSARIGRVTFSKTRLSIYYEGRTFFRVQGFKTNYRELETGNEYWISGPRRDGQDRLYVSNLPVEIDEDVREEYWIEIRKKPDLKSRSRT
jgi:hypothetical protein